MINTDLYKEIIDTINHNKVRTILTAFGVFLGIFMLVILVGAGNSLTGGVKETFSNIATNSAFFIAQNTSKPYKGYQRGRSWSMNTKDIEVLKNNIPGIKYVVPRLIPDWVGISKANNTVRKDKVASFNVYGDYPVYKEVDKLKIIKGRWLNDIDIKESRKVCLIGESVFSTLFKEEEDPIGKYIQISGIYYQVIGVFRPLNGALSFGGRKEESIIVPFSTLQRTYNLGDVVHLVCIVADLNYTVSDIEIKANKLLRRQHKISPDDNQAVMSFNIEKELKKFLNLFNSITFITLIVGGGTLISGIIGVGNIMLVAIKERTKTIGIQRAIGATPLQVVVPILFESIFITSVAGFVGLSSGVFFLQLVQTAIQGSNVGDFFAKHMQINISIALGALGILILGGILAGALPAQRALRINPVDALRDE